MVDNKEIHVKTIEIKGLTVQGVMVRTRNADEGHAETARIGKLWQDFAAQVEPRMSPEAKVYGVYSSVPTFFRGERAVEAQIPNVCRGWLV